MVPDMDDELLFRVARGEAGFDEIQLVEAWRRQAPKNDRQYAQVVAILGAMTQLESKRSVAESPAASIVTADERYSYPPLTPWWRLWSVRVGAIAAVVLLGVGTAVWQAAFSPGARSGVGAKQFVTGAQSATIELKDSTVVRLAPHSRLQLLEARGVRAVSLEGRAYFAVAKNPSLPFRIRTDAGDITVLGTRFDVETAHRDLRLMVVEGRVALRSPDQRKVEVAAGEMSQVKEGRLLPVVRVPDMDAAIGWTGTFLAFQATPLRDALREIERQYHVRVVVTDSAITDRTLTMWFSDEPLDTVVGVICLVLESRCSLDGEKITIQANRPGSR